MVALPFCFLLSMDVSHCSCVEKRRIDPRTALYTSLYFWHLLWMSLNQSPLKRLRFLGVEDGETLGSVLRVFQYKVQDVVFWSVLMCAGRPLLSAKRSKVPFHVLDDTPPLKTPDLNRGFTHTTGCVVYSAFFGYFSPCVVSCSTIKCFVIFICDVFSPVIHNVLIL